MNQSELDLRMILNVLKQTAKSRGYTYAKLARRIGVSEVTMKRLFSCGSPSSKYLFSVCDALNISLLEVAAIARDQKADEYTLSDEQDRYFAADPQSYAIFIALYRRTPASEVRKYWKLDEKAFFKKLMAYEKLGLLEVHRGDIVRFRMSGPIKVPARGKLVKVFHRQNLAFLEFVQNDISSSGSFLQASEILLSEANVEEFLKEIQAITKKVRSQSFVDETILPRHKKKSVRWLFAFAPFETDWR